MRTIHHEAVIIPARYIPAYDEHVYTYDELSDDAKRNALDNWIESGSPRAHFDNSLDEILLSLDEFSRYTGIGWETDAWNNVILHWTDETEYAVFSDNGFYASMDIADAWNKHVDTMLELYTAYEEAPYGKETDKAYRALKYEVDCALDDVRRVTQRNIDDEWDYWIFDPKNAFEEFGMYDTPDNAEPEFTESGEVYAA